MKRKQGFTLIELLAIIVILALIAVIISPIILGIIEDSKLSAATDSAYGYKEAVGKYYASQLSQNSDFLLNGEYTIGTDGSISDSENTYDIAVSGTAPRGGSLTIEKGTVTAGCIQMDEYAVTIEDKKVTSTVKGTCENMPTTPVEVVVEEFPTVTDSNPGIICGNGTTEDYDNSDTCYIYSVEDLVEFASLVNSGKDFSSKTVMLMNGLDIEEDKSYANPNSNAFGDVNENSTTSTTLKEELTTGKGFKPIGNNSNKFSGTFNGNAHTIKNLNIKRSGVDYVGFVGYNRGTIKGIKFDNVNVTGNKYVGIIAGYNTGNVTSTIAIGSINGNEDIGLAVGYNSSPGIIETVVSGNVSGTYTDSSHLGGIGAIVGYLNSGTANGINLGGSVTASNGWSYKAFGCISDGTAKSIVSSSATSQASDEVGINKRSGVSVNQTYIKNIGTLETTLDTYVAGDNNNDGYYYDNDSEGNIVIYSTTDKPLTVTMAGTGANGDPYLIANYNQLKEAAYDTTKHYKLTVDINMENKNPIVLASEVHPFTGTFDGGAHTISNGTYGGYDYAGIFGYNQGTIKGLKIENISVIGHKYVGTLIGFNTGNATSTIVKGNASGYEDVGIAAGYNGSSGTLETVVSGNVSGTYSNSSYLGGIGGIVGYANSGTVNGINLGGSVTASNAWSYKAFGYIGGGTIKSIVSSSTTSQASDDTGIDKRSGVSVNQANINKIGTLEAVLDTYVAGDNNNDGYYYDNDENGNATIYNIIDKPLTITMSGSGTSTDPYKITNYNQLKEAAYDTTKYYRLDADINMQNNNSIVLASQDHHFTGTFDGNTHTISNGLYGGYDYAGLFGYNQGTIKGLKLENISVTAHRYVGIIAGYNVGTITTTIATGTVNGHEDLGLAVGNNSSGTTEAVVSGNVSGTYSNSSYLGGIAGIVGYLNSGTVRGINLGGTITASNGWSYRTIGCINSGTTASTGGISTVSAQASETGIGNKSGKTYTAAQLQTTAPYTEVGLNTSSTTGEYRYALDSSYNPYIVKNTNN